jgi:hypothetical protein
MQPTNMMQAAAQYASRPQDERYESLQAMVSAAMEDKRLSKEATYNLRDLQAQAVAGNTDRPARVMVASPRGAADLTHWSFQQLCRMVGAPAGYLRDLPPTLGAECLNHGLQTSAHTDANLLVKAANGNPYPVIRAATTKTYGRVYDADLYGTIGERFAQRQGWDLPPTWEGPRAGAYRGDRDSFLLLTNGGSIVTDASIANSTRGDSQAMYRGLLVRNSEVGACSVIIDAILYRYICGNHIIWGAVFDKRYRRRHVGNNALRDSTREILTLARRWADRPASEDEAIIRALVDKEIAHSKEAVIDELTKMGATKADAEAAYNACELNESASPRSFWGAAQGFTRISQESGYQDERYELDRLAATVLTRGAKKVAA